jgi:hypothetical protein
VDYGIISDHSESLTRSRYKVRADLSNRIKGLKSNWKLRDGDRAIEISTYLFSSRLAAAIARASLSITFDDSMNVAYCYRLLMEWIDKS